MDLTHLRRPLYLIPMEIWKDFTFEAAHKLPNLPEDHKCARLHGHSYQVRIYVEGDLDPHLEWVVDFADIKQALDPILEQLDHYYLNDIDGLENPTSEILVRWIWQRLKPRLPSLSKIQVAESCTCGVVYQGEEP